MKNDIAGAILSGGKSKRMGGENKAFIELEGTPIIQRILKIFKEIFDEILLITNDVDSYKEYEKDCCLIKDKVKNVGPLGGIHAGLSHTSKKGVFFIACDMPFLHNEIIREQLFLFEKLSCDALIPKVGNFIEPLHGVYSKKLKIELEFYLRNSSDYSIRKFLETVNSSFLKLKDNEINRKQFQNLNRPCDLENIKSYESKI